MCAGLLALACRQAEPRPFQMAIRQVQAHLTALGQALRFVQIRPRALVFARSTSISFPCSTVAFPKRKTGADAKLFRRTVTVWT